MDKDLKVNLDLDTSDMTIDILKIQNNVLKMQLEAQKFIDSQNFNLSQRTVKQAKQEFLNRVANAFKETYGYPIESAQLTVKDKYGAGVVPRNTFCIEINTVGVI